MLKMYVVIEGTIGGLSFKEFNETDKGLGFGGYCFRIPINGKEINVNFDFPGYAANVQEDGTLLLEAGATTYKRNDELDDCYDEEYKELGITRDVLTAKVLASATKIEEFVVDTNDEYKFKIKSIEFLDEIGKYSVAPGVIKRFEFTSLISPF